MNTTALQLSLTQAVSKALESPHLADRMEAELICAPQTYNPIFHHFGPNIYIREAHLPAGSIIIGHKHKQPTLNVFMSGELLLQDDNGNVSTLKAPMMFVSPAGRKVALTVTDCVWLNIWSTPETDVRKLEEDLLEKSEVSTLADELRMTTEYALREPDRKDFLDFCAEFNLTPEQVASASADDSDYVHVNYPNLSIRKSAIQGDGVFASSTIPEGSTIGVARMNGKRTPLGRFVNHSAHPNAYYIKDQIGDLHLVAKRQIMGSAGWTHGEEITVDYRQAMRLNRGEE